MKTWAVSSLIGLCLFSLYQVAFHITERTAATNVFLAMGILTIILVLSYFSLLIRTNKILRLSDDPVFWIATGLLFFLSGNIVATGFYHKLRANPETASMARNLYLLNYVLSILKSILFSIAFVIAARKPQHG